MYHEVYADAKDGYYFDVERAFLAIHEEGDGEIPTQDIGRLLLGINYHLAAIATALGVKAGFHSDK